MDANTVKVIARDEAKQEFKSQQMKAVRRVAIGYAVVGLAAYALKFAERKGITLDVVKEEIREEAKEIKERKGLKAKAQYISDELREGFKEGYAESKMARRGGVR